MRWLKSRHLPLKEEPLIRFSGEVYAWLTTMFYLTLLLVHLNFFYLSASPEGEENSVIALSGGEA